ncbi:MAG: phosphoribosyltransferase [Verrucomicrobiia bacterium]
MDQEAAAKLVQNLRAGLGVDGLFLQLKCSTLATNCDAVYLALRRDNKVEIISAFQLPPSLSSGWTNPKELQSLFLKKRVFLDFEKEVDSRIRALIQHKYWRFVANIPLRVNLDSALLTLTCVSFLPKAEFDSESLDLLQAIADSISYNILFLSGISPSYPEISTENVTNKVACQTSALKGCEKCVNNQQMLAQGATSRFLLETLLVKRQIRSYKDVTFTTFRAWRSSLKEWQILALRLLKADCEDGFCFSVAQDIANSIREFGIHGVFDTITSVPCGHSGAGCLSERVGMALANILGLRFAACFDRIEVVGSSHPRKNATRPKMKMLEVPRGNYLLIDDVVTSGSHLSEATSLLRKSGSNVFPIGWIGP